MPMYLLMLFHQVRKWVVGFIEDACRKDTELLPKVIFWTQQCLV